VRAGRIGCQFPALIVWEVVEGEENAMRWISSIILLLTFSVCASAGLVTYNSEANFQAAGSIAYNTNWDSFTGDFEYPGDPYTIGGVTYTSGDNVIVGPESFYGNLRSMMFYNFWTPLTADVLPTYNMLGFDAGVITGGGSNSLVDITVYTNFDTYQFNGLTVPYATNPLQFFGFITDSMAESITGFALSSENGELWAPGITDVQVGNTAAIPEPASALLTGCAVLLLGVLARRRNA
jgi:hypothetical protein